MDPITSKERSNLENFGLDVRGMTLAVFQQNATFENDGNPKPPTELSFPITFTFKTLKFAFKKMLIKILS